MSRLLVVGDAMLDRDVDGSVERLCPDAPAPVLDVRTVDDRPGGAGLAALLAAHAGATVTLATGLGQDAAGDRVRALLAEVVGVHAVLRPSTTPSKTRVRTRGQSLVRMDDAGHLLGGVPPWGTASDELVDEAALEQLVLGSDAVLVADYGGAVTRHSAVRDVLRRNASAVPIVWDPHPRGLGPVPGVRVVTPNRAEALGFAGALGDQSLDLVASRLRSQWQVEGVAVTDGARGAVVSDGTAATVRCSAPVCPPSVDTCGAGDRFAVSVALGLADGSPLSEAVRRATVEVAAWLTAGGVSLATAAGSSQPEAATSGDAASARTADEVVERVRAAGGTVVAAGGCFDVLHTGHLQLLQTARDLGDCLVVALNSDASTRRLKGPDRPVNPAADRARLLEALRCVDAVVVFEDDEPSATLARLRPDVWVKGGDYRRADLPEAAVVEAYGGSVRVVPFVEGRSSTSLLRSLVRASGV